MDDNWFERVWSYREEDLYPSLFGPTSRGIFPITAEILTSTFKQSTYDPRWITHGVFEFAPTPDRESWLYVTSGLSNAWESSTTNPSGVSGLGCEFIFETINAGDWAILRLLHLMTFQILLAHGRYEGRGPLELYDRLPLRGSIRPQPSDIQSLMVCQSALEEVPLESGRFSFYQVVGISEEEATFARANGGDKLVEKLVTAHAFPVTDPDRHSVRLNI
jgi:hypothetical protein